MLFMLRFVSALKATGGRVILELPETLIPIAEESHLADEIQRPAETRSNFDVHAPLMDVPRLCQFAGLTCSRNAIHTCSYGSLCNLAKKTQPV